MEKHHVWKILTLISFVLCVGCAGAKTNSQSATGANDVYGTGDASSGAGTGSGATKPNSAGTGDATSGAGTGTGGTTK